MTIDCPKTVVDADAESRFRDWQDALTEWEARKGGPNRADLVLILARDRLKRKIVQDFFSRLDGPTASSDEWEFGFHVEDCYAVTPKDDFHGG